MAVDRIQVVLDLDVSDFAVGMDSAGNRLLQLGANANRAGRQVSRSMPAWTRLRQTLRDIVQIGAQVRDFFRTMWYVTGRWVLAIANVNGEMERMKTLLSGMSSEVEAGLRMEDATREFDYFLDLAQKAPFSLKGLTDAAVKFKSVGIDPTARGFSSLVDAVASFGGTEQTLARASVAVQQMAGKGVISMEELRQQMGEAVPSAMKLMARSMGLTMRDFVKAVSDGTVSAKPALDGMFMEMERSFGGSAQRMMTTWVGLNAQLKTEWQKFLLAIGDTGFFEQMKTSLGALIELLQSDAALEFAQGLGRVLTKITQFIEIVARFVANNGKALLVIIQAIAFAFVGKFIGGIGKAIADMAAMGNASAVLTARLATVPAMLGANTLAFSTFGVALSGLVSKLGFVGVALRGLGAALSTLAGPIGIVIALIGSLGLAWFNASKEADRALEIMRGGGEMTLNQFKATLIALDELIAKTENHTIAGMGVGVGTLEEDEEKLKVLLGERADTLERLNDKYASLASQRNAKLKNDFAEELSTANAAYSKAAEAMDAQFERTRDSSARDEEHRKLTLEKAKALAEIMVKQQEEVSKKLAEATTLNEGNDTASDNMRIANAQLSLLAKERNQIWLDMSAGIQQIDKNDAATRDLAIKTMTGKLDQYVLTFEANAAKAREAAAGATGELAKFDFLMSSGRFEGAFDLVDSSKIEEMRQRLSAATAEIERQNAATANATKVKTLSANADRLLSAETQRLSIAQDKLNSTTNLSTRRLESLDVQLTKLRDQFPHAGKAAETFEATLKSIADAAQQAAATNFLADSEAAAKAATLSGLTAKEQLYQNHAENLAQIARDSKANLELLEDPADKVRQEVAMRAQMLGAVRSYHEASADLAEDALHEWALTQEDLKEMSMGWMDEFIDQMAEGETSFGDLARSIIADVAKILIKLSILKAFGQDTGGGVSGGTDFMSTLLSGLFSGIASGVSGSTISTTGGIDQGNGVITYPTSDLPTFSSATTGSYGTSDFGSSDAFTGEVTIHNRSGSQVQATTASIDPDTKIMEVILDNVSTPGEFRNNIRQAVN